MRNGMFVCSTCALIRCHVLAVLAQSYAKHVHEFKESAGLKEVSVGYVVAGDFAATPKSAQYSLLRKGALEEKDIKRLQKCPTVRTRSQTILRTQIQLPYQLTY